MKEFKGNVKLHIGALAFMLATSMQQNAFALAPLKIGDVDVGTLTGYASIWATWNLQSHPESDGFGNTLRGKGELSMLRETLQLQYVNANLPSFLPAQSSVTLIGRLFKESRTTYLKRLDAVPTQTGNLMDNYNSNSEAIREAFIDIPFSKRVNLRFGKQQVVWGETDIYQAMDIVNARDLSWSFAGMVPEDEDLRKPLIMANMTVAVPEWDGSFQLLYRPGWDRETQVGATLDVYGGRYAGQPTKGVNPGLVYNYHHSHGDTDDASYGFRWTGQAGDTNATYSLAYYHSVSPYPVVNVGAPGLITPYKGSIGVPGGAGAEFILPEFDLVGGTLNAYIQPLDLVLRMEGSFTKDKAYNSDSVKSFASGTILEKNTVNVMVGFDKQFNFMDILGTDSASFFTFQLFDTWIPSFDENDRLLDGGAAHLKAHSVNLVTTLGLSYANNQIQPSIALVTSTSYGSGALIPGVTFLYGNHWRLLVNAILAMPHMLGGCNTAPDGSGADCTHGLGGQGNNSQLGARLTYQF